jgi:hypothetical protein
MSKVDVADRLEFLAEKFSIFECDEKSLKEKMDELVEEGYTETNEIYGDSGYIIALVSTSETRGFSEEYGEYVRVKKKVSIAYHVFKEMVDSDLTTNKQYTQWMLTTYNRFLKEDDIASSRRFVEEDLPLAKEYLDIFDSNKRKKKFKELCLASFSLRDVKDPTNINQYKSLSQLYEAVDPFIYKDPSEMERLMQRFVDAGQAEIPVKDRRFTVYLPKTKDANLIFNKFASWCTTTPTGGMFEHYTSKNKKPNGKKSDIYIVIDNRFFKDELEENYLYQLHFETNQIRNRKQNGNGNFFEDVIMKSEGVSNFFHEELTTMAKASRDITNNIYIEYLIKFGWTEALFDIIEDFTPIIRFTNRDVPKLPDVSKFSKLSTLIINGANLRELHPSIGKLGELQELILPDNKLTILPKEIGNLTNLIMLNIMGNNIKEIPDEIKYLDKTNGGRLHRIAFNREQVGEANYRKLKTLLPSVKM